MFVCLGLVACRATDAPSGAADRGAADATANQGAAGPMVAVAESGDVVQVHNSAADLAAAPVLRLDEELRIGVLDGPAELQFSSVRGIDESADGTIWVLDNSGVRAFDRNGEFVRRFGRNGQGPGEFQNATQLVVAEDSVVVLDRFYVHHFTGLGELRESRRQAAAERVIPPTVVAAERTPDAWLVARQPNPGSASQPGRPGPYRDSSVVQVLDGDLRDVVLRLPGREFYLLGELGWLRFPFMSAAPQYAIGKDGLVHYTSGEDYRIESYAVTRGGDAELPDAWRTALVRRVTGDVTKSPVTQAQFDSAYSAELRQLEGRPQAGEVVRIIEMLRNEYPTIPRAEFAPVLGRILAAATGRILVERLDLDPRTWDLLDADGRIAGRVRLPERFFPLRFVRQHLYGTIRDEFDVQYVVRYRLAVD